MRLHLGLGCLEVASRGGDVGLDSADIGLDACDVAGDGADLLIGGLLLLRELGGLGVLRLLCRKNHLGAGVDLLLGGADVLAEGIGGGAQAGVGGVEAVGQVNVLLVGCGKTLLGCGDAVLQAVTPTQRAYAQQSCNDDRCDECSRGGPLGYDDWFCIAHELLPLAVASYGTLGRCRRLHCKIAPRTRKAPIGNYSSPESAARGAERKEAGGYLSSQAGAERSFCGGPGATRADGCPAS